MAKYPYICLKFVWRQSESAIFGAPTSVGALFTYQENTMEEKILIKSEFDKKAKIILSVLSKTLLAIPILIFLYLLLPCKHESRYTDWQLYDNFGGGYEAAFNLDMPEYLVFFIIACVLLVLGIIAVILSSAYSKCELSITEKNVKGKTFFGKNVVLPIYMISSYTTSSFLSVIKISSSSGTTTFGLVKNYPEIANVLSQLINQRQNETVNESKTSNNNLDELVKLKSLLDQGIITQEEFDAKKKELLGL